MADKALKVCWTRLAYSDRREIVDWIAQRDLKAAEAIAIKVPASCEELILQPRRGSSAMVSR